MFDNPDPKRYVIKVRRGKPILVDKQILRWRKKRKKDLAEVLEAVQTLECKPTTVPKVEPRPVAPVKEDFAAMAKKLFGK